MSTKHHYRITRRIGSDASLDEPVHFSVCASCNPDFALKLRVDGAQFEHHEEETDGQCNYCYDNPELAYEGTRLRKGVLNYDI